MLPHIEQAILSFRSMPKRFAFLRQSHRLRGTKLCFAVLTSKQLYEKKMKLEKVRMACNLDKWVVYRDGEMAVIQEFKHKRAKMNQ